MMKTSLKSLLGLIMKARVKILVVFCTILMLNACSDQTTVELNNPSSPIEDDMIVIAGTFAKALEDPAFRLFVKNEAVKKFDQDYDVLLQMIVDKQISEGRTVAQFLEQYFEGADFRRLLRKYPLLSIYVPKLPGFDADSWDANDSQVPRVAIAQFPNRKDEIRLVNSSNEHTWVSQTEAPDLPVIVLKENERVGIQTTDKAKNARTTPIFTNENFSYYFLDENGGENAPNTRLALPTKIDSKVTTAYSKSQNCSNCYHRDYIYYNISPSDGITQGPFDSNYAEAITALRFENMTTLQSVNGNWTEGDLEFHIIAMFIGGSSTLTQLEKVYHTTSANFYSNGQLTQNIMTPLVLVPWEMNVYGDKWKFNVYEYDPGTTTTITTSHSTTKSQNFSYDYGLDKIVKIGVGYGSSTTTVDSNSTTITTTTGSNQLGEAVHNWFDPIVV